MAIAGGIMVEKKYGEEEEKEIKPQYRLVQIQSIRHLMHLNG